MLYTTIVEIILIFQPIYRKINKQDILESKIPMYTKVTALGYGFICIATAFIAGSMGGILQASITIFGVIGGPILGLFSVGMFTARANQKVIKF